MAIHLPICLHHRETNVNFTITNLRVLICREVWSIRVKTMENCGRFVNCHIFYNVASTGKTCVYGKLRAVKTGYPLTRIT